MNDIGKKSFMYLELCGIPFIFVCGIFLSFLYEITDGSVIGIVFGSVNNSIWENVKLFSLPFVVWGVIELAFSIPYFRQFVVAKVFALYFQSTLIIVFFSFFRELSYRKISIAEAAGFFVIICISQLVSFKITSGERDLRGIFAVALGFLFLYGAMYFCFSVVPPHTELFRDPITDMYGIIPSNIDIGAYIMSINEA